MNRLIQETDSRVVYEFEEPAIISYPLYDYRQDETIGGDLYGDFVPLPIEHDVLEPAWDFLLGLESEDVPLIDEASNLLTAIQRSISVFELIQTSLNHIPPLRGHLVEDGSILFEWIFSDFRVGFSIEPNHSESSWYLIANQGLGEINASGYILGKEINKLIMWLLTFMLINSHK